ncbi:MAG: UpxY family transcription antiterminator [Bacteroidota bacterium]
MASNWYALYTKPRAEKKVLDRLLEQGIEAYLPLQKRLRQWKDRKKWVEIPLINSYVFVKIEYKDYLNVLNTVGAVRFIFFLGKAATIPEWQINSLKQLLESEKEIEISTENFKQGNRVRVISGVLIGLEGELISIKGNKKVIVRIDQVGYSISVNIPLSELKILKNKEDLNIY